MSLSKIMVATVCGGIHDGTWQGVSVDTVDRKTSHGDNGNGKAMQGTQAAPHSQHF